MEERVVSKDEEIILSWWDLMAPFILTMAPGRHEPAARGLQHLHPGAPARSFR